jgi:hypothetical protein
LLHAAEDGWGQREAATRQVEVAIFLEALLLRDDRAAESWKFGVRTEGHRYRLVADTIARDGDAALRRPTAPQ